MKLHYNIENFINPSSNKLIKNNQMKKFSLYMTVSNNENDNSNENLIISNNNLQIFEDNFISSNFASFPSDLIFHFCYKIMFNSTELNNNKKKTINFNPFYQKTFLLEENLLDLKTSSPPNSIKILLKIDYIYGLILTFFAKNFEKFLNNPSIKKLEIEDLRAIIINLCNCDFNHEIIFNLLNKCKIF